MAFQVSFQTLASDETSKAVAKVVAIEAINGLMSQEDTIKKVDEDEDEDDETTATIR